MLLSPKLETRAEKKKKGGGGGKMQNAKRAFHPDPNTHNKSSDEF